MIQMCDIQSQYITIKSEIDYAIQEVINSGQFINGNAVDEFSDNLSKYLGGGYVIPCASGTDALQIALMSLHLSKGDEVIIPAFNYAAAAEVTVLLGLKPVLIGEYALIGAGAVVTKDVPDYALVVGNPGRQIGLVNKAGDRA